jgi:hypothetical protein
MNLLAAALFSVSLIFGGTLVVAAWYVRLVRKREGREVPRDRVVIVYRGLTTACIVTMAAGVAALFLP